MKADPNTTAVRTWPIGDMLTEGCARTLAATIRELPGVEAADANFATGMLQVRYLRSATEPTRIASAIRACGFACRAPSAEASAPAVPPAAGPAPDDHAGHGSGHGHTKPAVAAPQAKVDHAGHGPEASAKTGSDPHEGMHHGGDLHAAAADMRRRFVIALVFSIPLFIWSPMGLNPVEATSALCRRLCRKKVCSCDHISLVLDYSLRRHWNARASMSMLILQESFMMC